MIELDRSQARARFHRAPFAMRHGLAGHDLFTLRRLVELAKSMPRDRIELNSGRLEPGVRPEDVPGIAMPAEDVIHRIENADAWLVIKGVELDPAYRALLHDFLNQVSSAAGPGTESFEDLQGFIFVSSAGSVTPFHFDAEENILVQIRGDKFVHIFDNADRSLVPEESLELSPSRHRNQPYRVDFERRAEVFCLTPGDAVHIPYLWPHWVHTGSSWCVSMAMTWKTPAVRRLNKLRLMNGTLRRYGLPQPAPGLSELGDAAKVALHDVARLAVAPLRRSEMLRRGLRGLIYGSGANYYYRGS
jgi:ribosomal protein L16 Arg81 hydroxylase